MTTSGASSQALGGASLAYRPDIDGLRAMAVLSVVGFHAFPGYFPGGFFGVDVFFVISGYLITGLLMREHEHAGKMSLTDFYARRIRRLFPALLLVVATTALVGTFLLFSHEFARLVKHVWASLFFVENILLASESGYFDVDAYQKPLLHFWSLAVEEQFYIVWPLALIALAGSRRNLALLITGILAASLAITFFGALPEAWHFYSPLTRAWELAAGAMLGWWHAGRTGGPAMASHRLSGILSLVALGALTVTMLLANEAMFHPGLITLAPVVATCILIATGPRSLGNRLLAIRPAVWIGLISYPLYLWHWPLLSYLSIVAEEERGPALVRLAMVICALVLAAITYLWIERPLRRAARTKRIVGGLAIGSLALAAVAGAMLFLRPAGTDRLAIVAQEQLEGVAWRWTANDLCRAEHGTEYSAFCMQNRSGEPDVFLFGNSYVNHLYPGLIAHPGFSNATIVNIETCEVSRSMPAAYDQCDAQWKILRGLPKGSLVIVSNQWPVFGTDGRMFVLKPDRPGQSVDYPDIDAYRRALTKQMSDLSALGHRVILIGPKAELRYDMADCYARPLRPATRDCRMDEEDYLAQTGKTLRLLEEIADREENIHYFDLAGVFCDQGVCDYRTEEGYPLLRDNNGHLSQLGSELVVRHLAGWMRREGIPLP
ncbi:acyltransferase family protein [Alteriqipengyuania sp.]|uniref:acyltransferase family protein n=1 Tax=Alteriqipengyuania sp. TaxID=2800692 RepID=UPI003519634D